MVTHFFSGICVLDTYSKRTTTLKGWTPLQQLQQLDRGELNKAIRRVSVHHPTGDEDTSHPVWHVTMGFEQCDMSPGGSTRCGRAVWRDHSNVMVSGAVVGRVTSSGGRAGGERGEGGSGRGEQEQGGKHSRGEQVALAGLTNLNLTSWSQQPTSWPTSTSSTPPISISWPTDQPSPLFNLARSVSTLTRELAKKGNWYWTRVSKNTKYHIKELPRGIFLSVVGLDYFWIRVNCSLHNQVLP